MTEGRFSGFSEGKTIVVLYENVSLICLFVDDHFTNHNPEIQINYNLLAIGLY